MLKIFKGDKSFIPKCVKVSQFMIVSRTIYRYVCFGSGIFFLTIEFYVLVCTINKLYLTGVFFIVPAQMSNT